MKKTLNMLLIWGSFSMSNAQTVLNALDPMPYMHEETRVKKINVEANRCEGPLHYSRGGYTSTYTYNYKSYSWVSKDDAIAKINKHFESGDQYAEKTVTETCSTNSRMRVLTQRYYEGQIDAYDASHPACTGRNAGPFYIGNAQYYTDYISTEYDYNISYFVYEGLTKRERSDYRFEGRCNWGGNTYLIWSHREVFRHWEPGYAQPQFSGDTREVVLR